MRLESVAAVKNYSDLFIFKNSIQNITTHEWKQKTEITMKGEHIMSRVLTV